MVWLSSVLIGIFLDEGVCQGWNDSFWQSIGLSDIVNEGYARIGTEVLTPGTPVGGGLSEGVAKELGLSPGLPVGTGIIDAHAGGIGTYVGTCIVLLFRHFKESSL